MKEEYTKAVEGDDYVCVVCGARYSVETSPGEFIILPCPCCSCMDMRKRIPIDIWKKWHSREPHEADSAAPWWTKPRQGTGGV